MKKYLESSKRYYYLSGMKNLKIHPEVHDELKVFAAIRKDSMSEICRVAIVKYLVDNGHKFKTKSKKQKP